MLRLLGLLLALLLVAPAIAAADPPSRIALPDGWQPEGIEAAPHQSVFVGSIADGSIWRADVRSGAGEVWAKGTGAPALGLAYDAARGLLWVAGGPSGEVRAYDARTRALVRTYAFPGSGFLNDVAITARGVYATDSFVQRLAVIRFEPDGSLPAAGGTLPLTGDIHYVAGPPDNPAFNANGIVARRGSLVIDQSATGHLFRVDPATGSAREVETFGTELGDADGLERHGRLLYVVRNTGVVQRLRLGRRLRVAIPAGTLSGDLDVPSTAALVAGALYVANARFGTPPTPTTPYWITRLPATG